MAIKTTAIVNLKGGVAKSTTVINMAAILAKKYGKKVLIMEPVKGGVLVNLPEEAAKKLSALTDGSQASFAIRYTASFPEVVMVLSGMGNMDMMRDNIGTFTNLKPMSDKETQACDRAREIIRTVRQVPCTACGYCTNVCQKEIPIPEILSVYNERLAAKITCEEAMEKFPKGKPHVADCIKCGKCETVCPQSIEIRKHFAKILDW